MSVQNRLVTVLASFVLTACAAVNTPDGGPRDTTKPKLVVVEPGIGSTDFKGKFVRLTFNEDVRPKDINQQLIITPNTGNTFSVRNTRQEIILEFDKPLEPNTTYSLNFREGIEDITEGNKAEPITLSFSTGAVLDTGMVRGTVKDYITGKPEANATVGLYLASDTSNIRDHKPYYFTKSAPDGSYIIRNIRNGDYRIFAHHDKNNNDFWDQEKEKIGYLSEPISIAPKADSVNLKMVWVDSRKPFVLKTENFLDKNTVTYNEGLVNLELKTLEMPQKAANVMNTISPDGKRVDIFPIGTTLPSKVLAFSTDSAGNKATDTLKLALTGKKTFPDKLTYRTKNGDLAISNQEKIGLEFTAPIQITGSQPFTIIEDSLKQTKPKIQQGFTLNQNKTIVTFEMPLKAKKTVDVIVDTTQILAVNDRRFNQTRIRYNITDKATTGSLSGTIKTEHKNYFFELLNDQGQIQQTLKNPRTFNFQNLKPGTYQIRVKIDENNDNKWSSGSLNLKTPPEKLYVYPKPLTVRANWDLEDIILIF